VAVSEDRGALSQPLATLTADGNGVVAWTQVVQGGRRVRLRSYDLPILAAPVTVATVPAEPPPRLALASHPHPGGVDQPRHLVAYRDGEALTLSVLGERSQVMAALPLPTRGAVDALAAAPLDTGYAVVATADQTLSVHWVSRAGDLQRIHDRADLPLTGPVAVRPLGPDLGLALAARAPSGGALALLRARPDGLDEAVHAVLTPGPVSDPAWLPGALDHSALIWTSFDLAGQPSVYFARGALPCAPP
jgi:hypothetical protein